MIRAERTKVADSVWRLAYGAAIAVAVSVTVAVAVNVGSGVVVAAGSGVLVGATVGTTVGGAVGDGTGVEVTIGMLVADGVGGAGDQDSVGIISNPPGTVGTGVPSVSGTPPGMPSTGIVGISTSPSALVGVLASVSDITTVGITASSLLPLVTNPAVNGGVSVNDSVGVSTMLSVSVIGTAKGDVSGSVPDRSRVCVSGCCAAGSCSESSV
jgi:hypothetical protein